MLTITDGGSLTRALNLPLDPRSKRLLIERRDQLGGDIVGNARFIVVQPGDGLDALETALGFSILQNQTDGRRFGDSEFSPSWEWLADHGYSFEMVFIMTDDGFAHVIIIEQSLGVCPDLLKLCRMYVTDEVQITQILRHCAAHTASFGALFLCSTRIPPCSLSSTPRRSPRPPE